MPKTLYKILSLVCFVAAMFAALLVITNLQSTNYSLLVASGIVCFLGFTGSYALRRLAR